MRSTTISFRGTREEVNALNIIARRNKKFVADMVRQALFAQYAADIQAIMEVVFFANNDPKISQKAEK